MIPTTAKGKQRRRGGRSPLMERASNQSGRNPKKPNPTAKMPANIEFQKFRSAVLQSIVSYSAERFAVSALSTRQPQYWHTSDNTGAPHCLQVLFVSAIILKALAPFTMVQNFASINITHILLLCHCLIHLRPIGQVAAEL